MNGPRHTLVIGGGVIGACCAWYLAKAGRRVTITDRGRFGAACSHANCGYVAPSHVLPLSRPGQLFTGVKALFASRGPLRIRPGLSPMRWSWLYRFARKCMDSDLTARGHARSALLNSSRALYDELIATESLNVEWGTDGLLFVFRDQTEFASHASLQEQLRGDFGVEAEPVVGKDLEELEPALKSGLAGAWHYKGDAYLRPDRLMSELHRLLQQSEVTIVSDCELRSFTHGDTTVTSAETSTGSIVADEYVVATGALTPHLNRILKCAIPIQPGKGYSITMARPAICPRYPLLLEEAHVGITPFASGYRIGSTMEIAGFDDRLNRARLNYLRDGAAQYLQQPTCEPVEEEWFGWRPMTPDGLPYIDRLSRFSNVLLAAGHNMVGLSMAPATGKLVSEMITGQRPHLDPAPYRIVR